MSPKWKTSNPAWTASPLGSCLNSVVCIFIDEKKFYEITNLMLLLFADAGGQTSIR